MTHSSQLQSLSDDELLQELSATLTQSRRIESVLVEHIAEVDRRRLYLREACSSMFVYCTEVLHLSESEAYLRIAVARASREHPMLLVRLADGRLHLSGIAKLAPVLTNENRDNVLARATHLSKRKIEVLVAELSPKPDVPPTIRKLPSRPVSLAAPSGGNCQLGPDQVEPPSPSPDVSSSEAAPTRNPPSRPEPLAPSRYKVQFTASAELREKLQRLEALMRVSDPEADLASVVDAAVTEKLERLEARRVAKTAKPRKHANDIDPTPTSRYIPAPVRRTVYERDEGRCTFTGENGKRCSERNQLEFHHVVPFARGGGHDPRNIRLVCRAHNVYFAERDFGPDTMEAFRRKGDVAREPAPGYFVTPSGYAVASFLDARRRCLSFRPRARATTRRSHARRA